MENGEVFRRSCRVAVSVIALPAGTRDTRIENEALPLASVVIVLAARKVAPSPAPDGSQAGLEKSSIRYDFEGAAVSVAFTLVVVPSFVTEVIVGATWLPLAPATRTMPLPPLWSIELRRIRFPDAGSL